MDAVLRLGEALRRDHGREDAAGRFPQEILRRRLRDEAALADHGDLRSDGLDVGDDVRREDHDAALADLREQVAETHALLRVEADRRLVDDDELRIAEERLGDAEALAHAAGVAAEPPVRGAVEVRQLEQLAGRGARAPRPRAPSARPR